MQFGLTSIPMCKWLKFGQCVMLCALQKEQSAKVYLLNENLDVCVAAISAKCPVPENVLG